jgi:hypothetical protein
MRGLEIFGGEVEILARGGKGSEPFQSNIDGDVNQFVGPASDDAMAED